MKKQLLCATIITSMLTTGCSSIVSDSNYPLAISSKPSKANFTVTNRVGYEVDSGVTPSTIYLPAGSGYFKGEIYTISFNKEGYESKTFTVRSEVDGWYWGNILLGGVLGLLIVDPITGAMYKLPDRVDIPMDQIAESSQPSDLEVTMIDSLTDEQKERLQPLN